RCAARVLTWPQRFAAAPPAPSPRLAEESPMTVHATPADGSTRTRCAIVGLGGRAQMYVRALAATHADRNELVAFCDVNQTRMDAHNKALREDHDHDPVPTYAAS